MDDAARDELDLLRATGVALRLAVRVEQIERRRTDSRRLGFAQVDYGRLFVRDEWTLFSIARELGCTIADLLPPKETDRGESRATWSSLVEASERLLSVARGLPEPIRSIVLLSAVGLGLRRIAARLPGRALFSLAEDLARGVARVALLCERDVRLLSSSEHPRLRGREVGADRAARCGSGATRKILVAEVVSPC
jgi:hypothetical protein